MYRVFILKCNFHTNVNIVNGRFCPRSPCIAVSNIGSEVPRQTLCVFEVRHMNVALYMFRLTGIFCTNLLFVYNAKSGVGSVQCDGNPILFAYRYGS